MNPLAYLEEHQPRFLAELIELLSIPSVSTDPACASEVRRAALYMAQRLEAAGLEHARVVETGGHPAVMADWLHAPGRPTLLLYGHIDVQSPDPLEAWVSPPFQPEVREGRLYGRGVADTKANVMAGVCACEAFLHDGGQLPVNIRFLLEAEEEVGSPSLGALVHAHREQLAVDGVIGLDGGQAAADQPSIGLSNRGIVGIELDLRTAEVDAHSGSLGGIIANAPMALVHLLATMKDPQGRVLVKGFYDSVRPIPDAMRPHLEAMAFLAARRCEEVGALGFAGEPGYSPTERNWLRPTLEVNGLWGGFQGQGSKTVIPAEAHAKITCRLVADQDPDTVLALLRRHIESHLPPCATVRLTPQPGMAKPYHLSPDHPLVLAASRVLERLYGRAPLQVGVGGTGPAKVVFAEELGADSIGFGFSLSDERVHAPNEFFRLSDLDRSRMAVTLLLAQMGGEAIG